MNQLRLFRRRRKMITTIPYITSGVHILTSGSISDKESAEKAIIELWGDNFEILMFSPGEVQFKLLTAR